MKTHATCYLLAFVLVGATAAQEPFPIGIEFQVNSYTTNRQNYPSVHFDPDGGFVVVWASHGSYGSDDESSSIQGQRFDASGVPISQQFQINSYTTGSQRFPSTAVESDGDFVVVWTSDGSDGTDSSDTSVQAQRYDPSGAPIGSEFQVNLLTANRQWFPSVAAEAGGDFVVVWASWVSDGTDDSFESVQAQRFEASGTPVGGQFQVNSFTTGYQSRPSVGIDPEGDFVVVWTSDGSYGADSSDTSVQAQRYDSSGAPMGGEFQINSYTTGSQRFPSTAVESDGDFVVVWTSDGSYGTDSSDTSVQAQRYDSYGAPIGGEFQVNLFTTNRQWFPSVAVDEGGDFVVVWASYGSIGSDASDYSVQALAFDAEGVPIGGQFQVNTYSTSTQIDQALAVDHHGNLVVVWESFGSFGSDIDSWSIQGQRFSIAAIFTDDFESGETSAWSETVGLIPSGPITFISLQVTPGSVPRFGGTLILSALVRDNVGQGVTNAPVGFNTEAGTLGSGGAIVFTGSGGLATDSLTLTAADIDGLGTSSFNVSASTVDFSGSLIESIFTVGVQSGSPVADFTFSVNGLDVSFFNASTGAPVLSYSWNFDDGTMPANRFDQNPVHSYTVNDMVFNVTLTVTNSVGTDSIQQPVTVGNPP